VVIADRYTPTSLAYAGAIAGPKEERRLVRFIERLEHQELRVPRPDVVVYLESDAKATRSRMQKEKKLDRNERDLAFQKRVAALYAKLARRKEWTTVVCNPDESPAEIHERIRQALERKLR
jgi:dTMP kinase